MDMEDSSNSRTGFEKATKKMFSRDLGPAVPIAQPDVRTRMTREERDAMQYGAALAGGKAGEEAAPASQAPEPAEEDMVFINVQVTREERKKIRKLAADCEVNQKDLLREAVEMLFKKYGR